jgi:O-methyltransferase/aklanonic acid methyltransferase
LKIEVEGNTKLGFGNMPVPIVATKQMIEEMFDGAATSYNRVGPSFFSRCGECLVDKMPLGLGANVLDIATGTGAVLLPATRRVGPEGTVTGIDLSSAILQEAERATRAEGLTNVELRKMDAENLEFPERAFDGVTCAFALFLFPDVEVALREMYRVCKPGGCVGVTLFNKTPPSFEPGFSILFQQSIAYGVGIQMPGQASHTPQEVVTLLSRFGFRSIETHCETNDLIYASAEEWWAFLLTVGPRATIMSMNEEIRTRFKDEYFAKLRPMFRQDGLHISLGVIYAIAKR